MSIAGNTQKRRIRDDPGVCAGTLRRSSALSLGLSIKPGFAALLKDAAMKVLASLLIAVIPVLSGCISSSSPPAPAKTTTVIVPSDSKTTVICQDGSNPPC